MSRASHDLVSVVQQDLLCSKNTTGRGLQLSVVSQQDAAKQKQHEALTEERTIV